jgi:hypothetical protein
MDTEPEVTPISRVPGESWSAAGSVRKPPRLGRAFKVVLSAALAALVVGTALVGSYRVGESRGDKSGHERGLADGYSAGHDAGFADGRTDGYTAGRAAGYDKGKTDGYASGYSAGKKSGYADGFKEGANGGYGQGWTDGCLAVFTALGDDTAAAWSEVNGMFDPTFVSTVDRFSCY